MDLGIGGKKAIVCASSRGLGRGCALALAQARCELVLNGRDPASLEATAAEVRQRFAVPVFAVSGDVSEPAVQEALLAANGPPDILVNNNGGPPRRPFRELDRDNILAGVTQNLVTPFELIRTVIDGMAERNFGRIVNITSLSVLSPIPGLDLSSAARAGLTAMLAGIGKPFAARNVTVNNLLPGKLDTERLRGAFKPDAGTPDEQKARLAADIPAGRLGSPEEFGQICAFLCSVHAGYMTGQNIRVDGGLYPSAF